MGRGQTDPPQNIRKTASGCGGVPPDHRAPDHRNRLYAIQLRTISGMLRFEIVSIFFIRDPKLSGCCAVPVLNDSIFVRYRPKQLRLRIG